MIIQDHAHLRDIGRAVSGNTMKLYELHNADDQFKPSFDVVDDVHVFMINDPMFYRREYYPTMCNIADKFDTTQGKDIGKMLMPMIDKGCGEYCRKFNLGSDPSKLISLGDRKEIATKIVSNEMPRIKEGEYK